MRLLWLTIGFLAGTPLFAQGFEGGFADVGFGGLQGVAPEGRFAVETDWTLGTAGLQIGASATSLGADTSTAAFRAILTRDLRWPVRLGLSVAYETSDKVRDDTITFGFHGLYQSRWTSLEANLLLPNHIRETGAFSFNIAGEQWLTPDFSIKTNLYRLSTDLETPDYYTISLTANYAVTDRLGIFAEGFQTTSDDYSIKGNGTPVGVAYQFSPQAKLRASLDSLRPDTGPSALGATVTLQYDFGGPRDQGRMVQTAIVPDRLSVGAIAGQS